MAIRVTIPGPLRSYTGGRSEVESGGLTLAQVLDDLDCRFPGLRFRIIDEQQRIRPHIRLFINQESTGDLAQSVSGEDRVQIVCALTGG